MDGYSGNRLSYTNGGVTETYSPDTYSNRENSISGSHARSYTFDALGNTQTETGWRGNYTYIYDGLNRMTSPNNNATAYSYNGLSQRVAKSGSGGSFNYVYSPDGILLGETSSGGNTLTTQYVWFGGSLVAMVRSGTLYAVRTDHLGRPELVTTTSGSTVWQANNTAFDRSVTTNSFGGLNIGFPGQYYDAESGLYYNTARYYDSTTGRYIQSDPVGIKGGLNTYTYALNNPLKYVDSLGLDPNPVAGTGGLNGNYVNTTTNSSGAQVGIYASVDSNGNVTEWGFYDLSSGQTLPDAGGESTNAIPFYKWAHVPASPGAW